MLADRGGARGGPHEDVGEQARVDRFPHIGHAAGEAERLAELAADRGIGADHRREVHRDAIGRADDELRAQDGEVEMARCRQLLQVVLLQPIEVGVGIARRALSRRDRHRVQVDAVGLGALQQAHVAQAAARAGERREAVLQHREIGLHLVAFAPAGDQARLLEQRGVDDVRDARQRAERGTAGRRIAQVHREVGVGPLVHQFRPAPRQRHHLPTFGEKGVDRRRADDAAGACDQNLVGHGASPRCQGRPAYGPAGVRCRRADPRMGRSPELPLHRCAVRWIDATRIELQCCHFGDKPTAPLGGSRNPSPAPKEPVAPRCSARCAFGR